MRLNERETNPNPHVNFITALSRRDEEDEENARQLLRALAAQVKPVMQEHGMAVNSLNEYQHNNVFLGRNWNGGERVEIVLRGRDGRFQPISWLLGTLCHELAHIKHMNHGRQFEALNAQLCQEVGALQRRGYYGDGLWSSGQRLADSARIGGPGLTEYDLPEYLCGGAQSGKAPTQRRRRRRNEGPSNHTGRQTARKRKAGSRVTSSYAFEGSGRSLNEDIEDDDSKKAGAGFRKQAGSKKAREERALAVERRLLALQNSNPGQGSSSSAVENLESGSESEFEELENLETDQDRRQLLKPGDTNTGKLKQTTLHDFANDFVLPPLQDGQTSKGGDAASSSKRIRKGAAGKAVGNKPLTDFFTLEPPSAPHHAEEEPAEDRRPSKKTKKAHSKNTPDSLSYGDLVQNEVNFRKKEALGMQPGSSYTLGNKRAVAGPSNITQPAGRSRLLNLVPQEMTKASSSEKMNDVDDAPWSCAMCTLINEPSHLACSVCDTPRDVSTSTL